MAGGRFRELMKKYGKVELGIHFSVSAAIIAGLYVTMKSNIDVISFFEKVGLGTVSKEEEKLPLPPNEFRNDDRCNNCTGDWCIKCPNFPLIAVI